MVHFLLVTYPAQGHINPSLQCAMRLARFGANVTFGTTAYAHQLMVKSTSCIDGLTYASYSDGYDDGFNRTTGDRDEYWAKFKEVGSRTLSDLIHALANEGRPVTCIVYSIFLTWVADVANDHSIPSVLLWIQPATVFAIYYHYFHGYEDLINKSTNDPSTSIEIPGLPPLTMQDLPSFLLPSSPHVYANAIRSFKYQFDILEKQAKPTRVLFNTFDALEPQALTAVDGMDMVAIGPLIPSAFLDGDPSDISFGGDLFQNTTDYIEWLDSKPKSSVVYVSFGSLSVLQKQQMEEVLLGLKKSATAILWVVRKPEDDTEIETEVSEILGDCGDGLVVPWCSQVEVLSHPSVGCFVTHCGWNSTLESLVLGVPVVGVPQWTDQATNAKLMEGFCKKGVRAKVNKDGILEGDELKRCLDLVMGDGGRGEDIRSNCVKWRDLAREAISNRGSSDRNIREFVAAVSNGLFFQRGLRGS